MRYTREETVGGKKVWKFSCPKDVAAAGLAESKTFTDGRAARYEIPRLIKLVDDYRKGKIKESTLGTHSLLIHLRNNYLNSEYFKQVAGTTQKQYESTLNTCMKTPVGTKTLGEVKVTATTSKVCREVYNRWTSDTTVATANSKARVLSILLNYGVSLELLVYNPMSKVKKLKHEPNTKIWTQEEVERFLHVGYSRFETRNITLLTHLCYEWGQRPKDISLLTWQQFDFTSNSVTIKQTKRGATVQLPLEGEVLTLLKKQKADWDFQPYVVPHLVPSGTNYKTMDSGQRAVLFNEVRERAGLPSDLKLGALRKTAIMEMVEAGVDSTGIMQVTGHKNISSLNPYMKHTLKGATNALTQRRTK